MKITLADLAKTKDHHRVYQGAIISSDNTINDAIDVAEKTIWFTAVSDNNTGERETWSGVRYLEQIDVETINVDNFRIFIKDHTPSTDNVIGRVEEVIKEDGKLKAKIKFSNTQSASDTFQKYQEGILTDVSIGYRYDLSDATIIDGDIPLVILRNIEVYELSSVWMGFDRSATIGREIDTKVDDSLLPIVSEEGQQNVEGLLDPETIALRMMLMRRNLKLKIKTKD